MSLELKRKEVELLRVIAAKEELKLKIEEKLEEIKRIQDHVKIQESTENKLKIEINNLKG